jgi:polyhydroxyalkanoate synthesis regulator phasin
MVSKQELQKRLEFRKAALDSARTAYIALLDGRVKSYAIGGRNLTRFDLSELNKTISELEKEVSELEAKIKGKPRRRAVGVVARDW